MLIDTIEKLNSVKPKLLACMNPCVDTESTGLSIFGNKERQRDVVIGIAIDIEDEAYYFPFRHKDGINLPLETLDFFRLYLSDPHRTYQGFNYNYDLHMMAMDGIGIAPNFEDAMLAMFLINENEPNFKLKPICDRYGLGDGSLQESILEDKVYNRCMELGLECSKITDSKHPNNVKSMMYVLPPQDVEPYACDDVILTRLLLNNLKQALQSFGLYDIFKQYNYYSYIITLMEHRGMPVSTEIIEKYKVEAIDKIKESQQKLNEIAGFDLNPNSSKKVCEWLGIESSAAERLEEIMDSQDEEIKIKVKALQEARGWKSVDSRYYTPYTNLMDENHNLHCSLNLIGTITGRLACSNPNLQAVARHTDIMKVKDVFVARPGYIMFQADYKQAEMRLVNHYTKDKIMRDLIESETDLHSATAEMLSIPRTAAKRINFSVIYGVGYKSLAQNLRIPEPQAKEYLEKYHGLYPGFRKLMAECEEMANLHGYIEMWTGRLRHFNSPQCDPHNAMSNLIQGGVAEIIRVAISRLYPAIKDLGGNLLLQVHDSVIGEVPENVIDIALPTIKYIMEDFAFVPRVGVDIEYGNSWGTFEKWKP